MPGWSAGIGIVVSLAIVVAVVIGVVFLVFWVMRAEQQAGPIAGLPRPIDILRSRYARGEISREEFEEKRRDLEDEE